MRRPHGTRIAPLAAMTVAAALAVASLVVYLQAADVARDAGRDELLASDAWFAFPLTGLVFSLPALVIHRHRPHLVGWVMHGIGILLAGSMIGTAVYIHDSIGADLTTGGRVVGGWIGFGWIPALVLLTVFLPPLFPSGRPPSRRWWWVAAVGDGGRCRPPADVRARHARRRAPRDSHGVRPPTRRRASAERPADTAHPGPHPAGAPTWPASWAACSCPCTSSTRVSIRRTPPRRRLPATSIRVSGGYAALVSQLLIHNIRV